MATAPDRARATVYALLMDADASRPAKWLAVYFDVLMVVSIGALCCQTVPAWRVKLHLAWFVVEMVVSGHFALRLLLKLACCPKLGEYMKSFGFMIDMLCTAPLPIELYLFLVHEPKWSTGLRTLRVLRFARLLQCKWLSAPELILFSKALKRSRPAFIFLAGYGSVALLCFAWAIFLIETSGCKIRGDLLWDERLDKRCYLQNVFEAGWMCLCTVATVGYGDIVPSTAGSKAVAGLMMATSYVMMSLPVIIFGSNLTELYVEARIKRRKTRNDMAGIEYTETEAAETITSFTNISYA